jgi:DNA gyrase subunit A
LDKAEKRAHIIEGLKIALDHLDLVISIIRSSKNRDEAKLNLMAQLPLTLLQTDSILDMQLYKLTGLEREKLEAEYSELLKLINYLKELLQSERLMLSVIKEELEAVSIQYADKRRTTIVDNRLSDIHMEDLIKDEECVILFTQKGYIKRTTLSSYKNQNRGTMGKRGFGLKEEDAISRVFVASAHDYILVFTEKGHMFWLKAYDIPEGDTIGKGKPINRLIGIGQEERVCSVINVKTFSEDKFVMLFSRKGYVKKTSLAAFSNPRANGIIAADVDADDSLFEARITSGTNEVILGTNLGKAIKFKEEDVREMGRGARGVRGIRLGANDFLVGADIIDEEVQFILTVTENGHGKKSDLSLYRLQSRGGKGLINIRINERFGKVIGLATLKESDDILLSSLHGIVNKLDSASIRSQGRATQGVRIINLRKGDKLVALDRVEADQSEVIDEENTDEILSDSSEDLSLDSLD